MRECTPKFITLILIFLIFPFSTQTEFSKLEDIYFINKPKFTKENNYTIAITSPLDTAYVYFKNEFQFSTISPDKNGLNFIDICSFRSDFFITALDDDNFLLTSSDENREILIKKDIKMKKIRNFGIQSYLDNEETKEIQFTFGISESDGSLTKINYGDLNSITQIDYGLCLEFDGFRAENEEIQTNIIIVFYLEKDEKMKIRGFLFNQNFPEIKLNINEKLLSELNRISSLKSIKIKYNQKENKFSILFVEDSILKIILLEGNFSYDSTKKEGSLSYNENKKEEFTIEKKYGDFENFGCDDTKSYIICGVKSKKEEFSLLRFYVKNNFKIIHQKEFSLLDNQFPDLNPEKSFIVEDYDLDIITYIKPEERIFVTLELKSSLIIWIMIIVGMLIVLIVLTCLVNLCYKKLVMRDFRIQQEMEGSEDLKDSYKNFDNIGGGKRSFNEVLGNLADVIVEGNEDNEEEEEEDANQEIKLREIQGARISDDIENVEIYD